MIEQETSPLGDIFVNLFYSLCYIGMVYYKNNIGSHKNYEKKKYSYFWALTGPLCGFILIFELIGTIAVKYLAPLVARTEYSHYLVEKYPNEEELKEAISDNSILLLVESLRKKINNL